MSQSIIYKYVCRECGKKRQSVKKTIAMGGGFVRNANSQK